MERVTPFAGVWIEITMLDEVYKLASSLPSRECGLKFPRNGEKRKFCGHSLRGSVD